MAMASKVTTFKSLATAIRIATRPGGPSMVERAQAVPRLVKAVRSGEYTGTSAGRLLMIAGAAGYLVSPVDLLPEALPGRSGWPTTPWSARGWPPSSSPRPRRSSSGSAQPVVGRATEPGPGRLRMRCRVRSSTTACVEVPPRPVRERRPQSSRMPSALHRRVT